MFDDRLETFAEDSLAQNIKQKRRKYDNTTKIPYEITATYQPTTLANPPHTATHASTSRTSEDRIA